MKKILLIGSEGYIGSVLKLALNPLYELTCHDLDLKFRGGESYHFLAGYPGYKHLTISMRKQLSEYDAIILLAGNSSVASCGDFSQTYRNNVENFKTFLDGVSPETKLIYASSGSVYNGNTNAREDDALFPPTNNYDMSKQVIDLIAQKSGKNVYGLRFGTVCMPSPNQRMDLLIQKMAWNAVHRGVVDVFNRYSFRSILGKDDLIGAIKAIIEGSGKPGVYNVASTFTTISEAAHFISRKFDAKVNTHFEDVPGSYSFIMQLGKMLEEFDFYPKQRTIDIINQFNREELLKITSENIHLYERR